MSQYALRVGMSKQFYQEIVLIFALGHYISHTEGEDDFSKELIYFYLHGNKKELFLEELTKLLNMRIIGDSISFDIITLYPTREKDKFNPQMLSLIQELSKKINIPYEQLINRNRTIKASHELSTFDDRVNNLKGSINISQDVKGKRIIILDNVSTTGLSLIDAANKLYENGAKEVIGLCLGLSSKEKEHDWVDLNKTLKYSRIKSICRTPFVSQEVRDKWKKSQKKD
jgi:hypothetical protein